jgi:hypothetical protein
VSRPEAFVADVRDALREYADRGVFRSFAERSLPGGRCELRFGWLGESVVRLRVDPRARSLTLVDLLPNVPYRSQMDRALRRFLRDRGAADLPDHRRLDAQLATLRCTNRKGTVSIELALHEAQPAWAAKRAVSLVNEIFHGFLRGPYHQYMVENFDEPEE